MKASFVLPFLFLAVASNIPIARAQSSGTFTPTGNLSRPRQFHSAILLSNGKVLIAGGNAVLTGWPAWASAELYNPSTGTFTATGDMTAPRFFHTATLLPNDSVLVAGGFSSADSGSYGSGLASAELYDSATGTFTTTGNMTAKRSRHTATLLNNGKVLIAGGYYPRIISGPCCNLASAELYDPSTGTFTATGDMTAARQGHTATLLKDGRVLIDGGYSNSGDSPASPELYDPATGTFSLTGRSAYPDLFATSASLLTNGKVLATLEYSCDADDQAEVYDPSNGTFTATGNMTTDRGYSTATLLPEGKVFIAGRYSYAGSADLYDPVTGTFTTTGDTQSAEGHTATLLPDGAVLLSGGWVCCGHSIATAEIYHPTVLAPSPLLFSVAGGVQGAILHAGTARIASSDNPAIVGEALEIYSTGLIDGSVIPPQVAIGGQMAEVLFFGNTLGFVGLNQVNVLVPSGVVAGPAVPVRLNYIGRPSNEVTIGVR